MKADPRTPPEWAHLPRFLLTSGGKAGAGYIMHCHFPRFLMSVNVETGSGLPLWIDKPGRPGGGGVPSPEDTALVMEAADYFKDNVKA
ncbi:MAG: hypothetical protein RI897_1645 [Verrucomicrobiota bacterium]